VVLGLAGGNVTFAECGSFLNVDALYGIKVICKLVPTYRTGEIAVLIQGHWQWITNALDRFWASDPDIHQVLGLCDSCGVLYQLGVCDDEVVWTDHFSNKAFYNSSAVIGNM
jgi:hypothetical protein